MGFAVPYIYDTGSALIIYAWDPAAAAFKDVARFGEESSGSSSYEVGDGVIRITKCRAAWRNRDGIFPIIETYKLTGQHWALDHDEADPKGKFDADGGCTIFEDTRLK